MKWRQIDPSDVYSFVLAGRAVKRADFDNNDISRVTNIRVSELLEDMKDPDCVFFVREEEEDNE
jgi:hypothetical protein